MICEIQYGGKVTDDFDRRLFNTYGNAFLRPGIVDPSFEFYKDYKIPVFSGDEIEKYMQYIETLPPFDAPGVFGLNENADISYRTLQSRDVLFTILDVQPKDSSGTGGETREEQVVKIADDFLSKLPADFNQDEVRKNIDEKLGGLQKSLNIFLYQEIERLQKLITCVRKTLVELKLAIDGTIIMSEELSDALNSLFDARVPKTWRQLSWYSATLGSWFAELLGRHQQLYNWMMHDRPKSFWMTGFYNPQGFLTAVRQEVTRAHSGWALDDAVLKTEVTKYEKDEVDHPPEGVYIHGLYLDGAAWDKKNGKLCESPKKVLVSPLPILYITATMEKKSSKKALFYGCPCYMNKSRTNANYIFTVELPTSEDPSHWIKRGVALLCKNE
jgi:dynein heavy chain